ncbi:small RNA-binding protein 11, chloroplastic-like isoform X2 [Quercus lobata]|uniref:small RNA-binding protein 11, chloroplastic-like isoform X2 n=1 Tax=Quercus lobata TaxID=97700 RepID=UPI00124488A2|nr:small RNA-binding protein 11, chloroplastic-like isoform X2 [Quercus lobata]
MKHCFAASDYSANSNTLILDSQTQLPLTLHAHTLSLTHTIMAALRGISHNLYTHISHPNPQLLFFFRGFSSKLFVKDISFSTTEETLAEAFSKFGEVTEAKIIRDKVRNRSKGYGYVSFAKEDEAKRALTDMNGKMGVPFL